MRVNQHIVFTAAVTGNVMNVSKRIGLFKNHRTLSTKINVRVNGGLHSMFAGQTARLEGPDLGVSEEAGRDLVSDPASQSSVGG